MSRSNKRRAARSDSRAAFAARAGDTASSESNNSMTRPAPLARNLGWAARSFSARATARRPRRKPLARPSRKRRPRRRPNPDRPGRGRLPLGPRRKDACAIAVASSGTGASQPSRRAKARSDSQSAKISSVDGAARRETVSSPRRSRPRPPRADVRRRRRCPARRRRTPRNCARSERSR